MGFEVITFFSQQWVFKVLPTVALWMLISYLECYCWRLALSRHFPKEATTAEWPQVPVSKGDLFMSTLSREEVEARGYLIGEGLSMPENDLNHAAHIDLAGGLLNGRMGDRFVEALSNQKEGHTNLLGTIVNLLVPPYTLIIPKVTLKRSKQILQLFGDVQEEVVKAFARAVKTGVIPKELAPQMCFNVGVFIDAKATDSKLLRQHNAIALDLAIAGAMKGVAVQEMDDLVEKALTGSHPLLGMSDGVK